MTSEIRLLEFNGMVFRVRLGNSYSPSPAIMMLHGWTGNEDSMWIFAKNIPGEYLILAPRGLYPSPMGGYGWVSEEVRGWPTHKDFLPMVDSLLETIDSDSFLPEGDLSKLHIMGFSQGAALAYSFALAIPERVRSLAGLSGFMPDGIPIKTEERVLANVPAFVVHGMKDELVPVERARNAVANLKQTGTQVSYCEHDVGHKLDANCFRSLKQFYSELRGV